MYINLVNKYFILVLLALSALSQTSAQKFTGLAPTPPMGWNSWNFFNCDKINEQVIQEMADAMISTGMKDVGYEYVVIDDCWQVDRDANGNIIVDPDKFPSGIKALADYVHSKGLKFGIYTCAGTMTCQKRPGSRGYEFQDFRQYAAWGVDFVKVDWCNTSTQDAEESYTLIRDAIYQAGRPMVLSICEWGLSKPWLWAEDVGHLWRTTGDIRNNWDVPDAKAGKVWGGGVIVNLDMQEELESYAGPDHWNDPDMLEIGNGGLTLAEERSHMSLWCMLAAPLMAGNDLRSMKKETIEILTNPEIIAIDQDPLGKQGYKIVEDDHVHYEHYEVFLKPLEKGDLAICFFNRGEKLKKVEVNWDELGITGDYSIRDVWLQKSVGTLDDQLKLNIPSHDVKVFRLSLRK